MIVIPFCGLFILHGLYLYLQRQNDVTPIRVSMGVFVSMVGTVTLVFVSMGTLVPTVRLVRHTQISVARC